MASSFRVERSTLPTAVVHGAGKKLRDPGAADENGGYQKKSQDCLAHEQPKSVGGIPPEFPELL